MAQVRIVSMTDGSNNQTGGRPQPALEYFDSIKGTHAGRRGFVIGNGPSLHVNDLSRLKSSSEICLASNKIYLAYPNTAWRPDYYAIADIIMWKKVRSELHHYASSVFLPDTFGAGPSQCRIYHWHCLGLAGDSGTSATPPHFSGNIAAGIFDGCSVTYHLLQLAVHLGLNPIFLIGCDHYYSGESGTERDTPVPASGQNHFISDYRTAGELVNPAPIDLMTRAYKHALMYAQQENTRIVNATRGGKLEVFPRQDFDSLWQQNQK